MQTCKLQPKHDILPLSKVGGNIMFIYEDNSQVKKEFKKTAIDQDITLVSIAEKCGINRQQLNNKFNNTRLALSDLSEWCDAMNCDLVIGFEPRKK